MIRLEDITYGKIIRGILPDRPVTVINASWIGSTAVELTYKDNLGKLGNELVYRTREPELEIVPTDETRQFNGDSATFRLVSEALRIHFAYLFDPLLAVNTSLVEPLPHQITAVYETMLPRQPLRFLLADDPGAGKTIMTGLFIKELVTRGDIQRCLIVCPGNLVEQWQDEMNTKFQLPFEIMTNEKMESARTGNWLNENSFAICRLDKLSRNEDIQAKLRVTDWDLIVCDESHKLSASLFGKKVDYTKRYLLGKLLSHITRHFLLLTATPHNGKEADFQLFMSLLDEDRFAGIQHGEIEKVDTSDLMRRMIKEDLLKFDGRPLFPERRAYTAEYELSPLEIELYESVTDYVRKEFNRADGLVSGGQKGTVGFALTVLQRRLASSPEAIYQSLKRRRERLEKRLAESAALQSSVLTWQNNVPVLEDDDLDDFDDVPDDEHEEAENQIVDLATAAQTVAELKIEIETLKKLEETAFKLRQSHTDKKWDELSKLLQSQAELFDINSNRHKLIIFTEHRDTLNYLQRQISSLLGRPEAVVVIHGVMRREDRKQAETQFTQDKEVLVLLATDAAGEGINLQRAHLLINYDLPWNPNRLEQRFGRIHRIGQTEVCHCWNLVASQTREGDVFQRLLKKLDDERKALGGKVFDVLGQLVFDEKPLRKLLLEAIRYGDDPKVRSRMNEIVDTALDRDKLRKLLDDYALTHDSMDTSKVREVREAMERAEARKLQPHFIASFFIEAFKQLGGKIHERETKRYEISHVPAAIRQFNKIILQRYERITFEKERINITGKPKADFLCPGHPLLDAVNEIILEKYRELLTTGAVLLDENGSGTKPRVLVYLEHAIQDARLNRGGNRRIVSKRLQFVEIDEDGNVSNAGYAPYLDYKPLVDGRELPANLTQPFSTAYISQAKNYAIENLVPQHIQEIQDRLERHIAKTKQAVKIRLETAIRYWDNQAYLLREKEIAGKPNAKINSQLAQQRADELEVRLKTRLAELEQERQITPLPPQIVGAALIVPKGAVDCIDGTPPTFAHDTKHSEMLAMQAVIEKERSLGFIPKDVSADKCGYDIESSDPNGEKPLRFIEVKGRAKGAETVTLTKNEILTALNKPEQFILAVVEIDGTDIINVNYIVNWNPTEPDYGTVSVNYNIRDLIR